MCTAYLQDQIDFGDDIAEVILDSALKNCYEQIKLANSYKYVTVYLDISPYDMAIAEELEQILMKDGFDVKGHMTRNFYIADIFWN